MSQPPEDYGCTGEVAGEEPEIQGRYSPADGERIPRKSAEKGEDRKIGAEMDKSDFHEYVPHHGKELPIALSLQLEGGLIAEHQFEPIVAKGEQGLVIGLDEAFAGFVQPVEVEQVVLGRILPEAVDIVADHEG